VHRRETEAQNQPPRRPMAMSGTMHSKQCKAEIMTMTMMKLEHQLTCCAIVHGMRSP